MIDIHSVNVSIIDYSYHCAPVYLIVFIYWNIWNTVLGSNVDNCMWGFNVLKNNLIHVWLHKLTSKQISQQLHTCIIPCVHAVNLPLTIQALCCWAYHHLKILNSNTPGQNYNSDRWLHHLHRIFQSWWDPERTDQDSFHFYNLPQYSMSEWTA